MIAAEKAQRFSDEVGRCPSAGSGVHSWVMTCANLAAIAELPAMEAEAEILKAMKRKPSPSSEVSAAIRKAYAEFIPGGTGSEYTPQPRPKVKPLPMTARAFIRRGDGAGEPEWWERSPYRIDWIPGPLDAITVLETLWGRDEYLFIGDTYGKEVATAGEWIERIKSGQTVPPHIAPNPMSGRAHPLADGKTSFRCDAAVTSFRYAVAEFDTISKADQLAFWWGWKSAPIAALIDSGGKSIHAWLRVDCSSREEWEREVEQRLFAQVLCPLGCDPACRNESRLSRLPGHYRREKGEYQRLLYLDPKGGAK